RAITRFHYQDVSVMELPVENPQGMQSAKKPAQGKDDAFSKVIESSFRKQSLLFFHVFEQVARLGDPPGDMKTLQERPHPADLPNGHGLDGLNSPRFEPPRLSPFLLELGRVEHGLDDTPETVFLPSLDEVFPLPCKEMPPKNPAALFEQLKTWKALCRIKAER